MANSSCVFFSIPKEEYLQESQHFFVVLDKFPVSLGHCLIVSKEPRADLFSLTPHERHELTDLIEVVRNLIDAKYQPDGYNIGMNCGLAAGQTVMHFHCHVIPRYEGDMSNPAGGVRHCVAEKGYYSMRFEV